MSRTSSSPPTLFSSGASSVASCAPHGNGNATTDVAISETVITMRAPGMHCQQHGSRFHARPAHLCRHLSHIHSLNEYSTRVEHSHVHAQSVLGLVSLTTPTPRGRESWHKTPLGLAAMQRLVWRQNVCRCLSPCCPTPPCPRRPPADEPVPRSASQWDVHVHAAPTADQRWPAPGQDPRSTPHSSSRSHSMGIPKIKRRGRGRGREREERERGGGCSFCLPSGSAAPCA